VRDEHVEVVEGHVAEANPNFAWARVGFGSLTELQRRRTVEADQFQRAHAQRVVGVRLWVW
jgi:hypothetical protein